jgi:hypothetical protein
LGMCRPPLPETATDCADRGTNAASRELHDDNRCSLERESRVARKQVVPGCFSCRFRPRRSRGAGRRPPGFLANPGTAGVGGRVGAKQFGAECVTATGFVALRPKMTEPSKATSYPARVTSGDCGGASEAGRTGRPFNGPADGRLQRHPPEPEGRQVFRLV